MTCDCTTPVFLACLGVIMSSVGGGSGGGGGWLSSPGGSRNSGKGSKSESLEGKQN